MSIDLEWPKLDSSLSTYLVEVLNKQLSNADRPSFIGPVEVTSLDFGSNAPDVELVDLRDIYRDFLDDEDDEDTDDLDGSGSGSRPVKVTEGGFLDGDDDEGFEWVSRRAAGRAAKAEESGMHHHPSAYGRHLPQHLHYGFRGVQGVRLDMFSSTPQLNSPVPVSAMEFGAGGGGGSPWSAGPSSTPDLRGVHYPWDGGVGPMFRSPTPSTPFKPVPFQRSSSGGYDSVLGSSGEGTGGGGDSRLLPPLQTSGLSHPPHLQPPHPLQPTQDTQEQQQTANPHPNLQLHFRINWQSNLRITITTSLLINYPSPMFMSLPIKLSVTGIVFSGEVAVAYEGERRRVHLCILDDLDPYGPAAKRDYTIPASAASGEHDAAAGSADSSPLETIPTPVSLADLDEDGSGSGGGGASGGGGRPAKPLPIGQRLLPSIIIESEIGQADKHVLKNVTRVERFIQDVIRKTVEEELVFPNFHTLVMGEQ